MEKILNQKDCIKIKNTVRYPKRIIRGNMLFWKEGVRQITKLCISAKPLLLILAPATICKRNIHMLLPQGACMSSQLSSRKGQAKNSQAVNLKETEDYSSKQEVTEPSVNLEKLTVSTLISFCCNPICIVNCFKIDEDSGSGSCKAAKRMHLNSVSGREGSYSKFQNAPESVYVCMHTHTHANCQLGLTGL